ncbi:MAG TPA: tRNA (N6-isopentenyl adenosine(37)-C2)-methylthiotransferase MiaB [Deltaproteobacteria bacterium]|nr:tRNA (N6-isopentenyl adenosine(37)-C2)-methylthiotransferase MiaB [Deltaproteobacteria bacterium]
MKGYLKIFTYGCQMNDLDSQKLYSLLYESGWIPTESTSEADLIIINTCSVRQKAYEKAMSNIGRLRKNKSRKNSLIIGVIGCAAQQEGKDLIERFAHVDFVLGTHRLHSIPSIVDEVFLKKKTHVVDTGFSNYIPSMDIIPSPNFMQPPHRAYINIMQGCNNYCSYCIVPFVRGPEISRDYRGILDEIRLHASRGVKEVFLLGQNVNSYNGGVTFHELLGMINEVDGIERIRFTTSHPKDMSDELIESFSRLVKLCPHVHLPFQSGSDRVLRYMNRHYTSEHYLGLIEKLRSKRKDIAFSSDVIVGFPLEEEADFKKTLDLIKRVRFDVLFSFKYSPRPRTSASRIPDHVPLEEKKRRLSILQKIQKRITRENLERWVGHIVEVLVDGTSKRDNSQVFGRTGQNVIVNFPGSPDLIGKSVRVRITRANPNTLTGEIA